MLSFDETASDVGGNYSHSYSPPLNAPLVLGLGIKNECSALIHDVQKIFSILPKKANQLFNYVREIQSMYETIYGILSYTFFNTSRLDKTTATNDSITSLSP